MACSSSSSSGSSSSSIRPLSLNLRKILHYSNFAIMFGSSVDTKNKRSFYKITVGNLFAKGHLMDVSIHGMQEIKLNFISTRCEDGFGFDCLSVGPAVVNALRRTLGTFMNKSDNQLSIMAVLQIHV